MIMTMNKRYLESILNLINWDFAKKGLTYLITLKYIPMVICITSV